MIRIPLTSSDTAAGLPGIRLGLPIGVGSASGLQEQVFRAVAAAVALADPQQAQQTVKDARNPAEDVGAVDRNDLTPVLTEVVRVREDRSRATVTDQHRQIAQAVGADPALVAAAFSKVNGAANANARRSGLNWIASVDVDLLERAARAASRRFDLIPSPQSRLEHLEDQVKGVDVRVGQVDARIGQVDARVDQVDGRVGQIDARVGEVDGRVGQVDARVGEVDGRVGQVDARVGEVDARIGQIDGRVAQLDVRVTKLEPRSKSASSS
jgi:methyl-accepting chemotaxis protein